MYKLNASERETIILFNEAEATAEIDTHNAAMKRRLEAVRRGHSEEIKLTQRDGYADTYVFPKKWIKIIPPRNASAKQREHLAQARANIKQ